MATAVAEFYAALPIGTHGPAGSTGGMGLVTDGAGVVTPEQFATRDWRAVLPSPGPRPLWLAYMRFEVLHASSSRDGARLRRLEARMLKALPPGSSVDEMAAAAAAAARVMLRESEAGGEEASVGAPRNASRAAASS